MAKAPKTYRDGYGQALDDMAALVQARPNSLSQSVKKSVVMELVQQLREAQEERPA